MEDVTPNAITFLNLIAASSKVLSATRECAKILGFKCWVELFCRSGWRNCGTDSLRNHFECWTCRAVTTAVQ